MIRNNDWISFPNGLDQDACDKIINLAKDELEPADEEFHNRAISPDGPIDIVWTNEQWIYDSVWKYMSQANEKAGWKYNIGAAEPFQIARYKRGMFYEWHADGRGDHFAAYDLPKFKVVDGLIRKLSMSAVLNDDYEGGELQTIKYDHSKPLTGKFWTDADPDNHISTIEMKKGSIVIFPSDIYHRVTPVTKGIRYSLTLWFLGPPYV